MRSRRTPAIQMNNLFYVLPHKGDKVNPTHIAGHSLPVTTNLPFL